MSEVANKTEFDGRAFRNALSSFATGVAIITTRDRGGENIGLTVNSFNSVSLDPPLVLWSLAKSSFNLSAFKRSEHWAVHILSAEQQGLSQQFATRGADKFVDVETESGLGEVPLLVGCAARFQCRTASQYEGGDHVIFVGEVLEFDRCDSAPLVFHGGTYAHATRRTMDDLPTGNSWLEGSFNEGFLGYLLGRSHFEFFSKVRPHLEKEQLSDQEFYVLSTLTLQRQWSHARLAEALHALPEGQRTQAVESLINRGLIRVANDGTEPLMGLNENGSRLALGLISAAKAIEAQVIDGLGQAEALALKSLLNRLLIELDPGANRLWRDESDAT